MTHLQNAKKIKPALSKTLFLAIAAQTLVAGYSHAGPTGGAVVGGDGSIEDLGTTTRINQDTQRLSLEWDTFNIAADERVEFVQPSSSATALNRILDNNGSQILGQIDANGRVILMNPNGILFGENATVNVGGLIASGLNIDSADFMNGELVFSALEDTAGTVVNSGLINAATGGNVALLGKTVANHGLITAHLGHIALASGSEAVVTFDDQGLIGVRIDRETLASEVDGDYAVENSGTLEAQGGKILLNASVSADLFSKAVNHGDMSGRMNAVVHDDGSFTLGAGNSVVNTGTADVSTGAESAEDAGYVIMAGDTVDHDGAVLANAEGDNRAGQVYAEASNSVSLSAASNLEANNPTLTSGKVSLQADSIVADTGAVVLTSGDTLLTASTRINVPEIDTHHLFVQSLGEVDQTCSVDVSGNAHLLLAKGANVELTNTNNDFNTLSMDARYNTDVQVADRNDIALNDLNIVGSSVRIHSLGDGATLSQSAGSHTQLYGSDLHLEADNVVLGENDSTTEVNHSSLAVRSTESVNTNHSITLVDDFALMPTSAVISIGESLGGLTVSGDAAIDVQADFDGDTNMLTIAHVRGSDAHLNGVFETRQTGPIHLSDTLTWNSGDTVLDHPDNDVAVLQGSGGQPFGDLVYVDSNDLTLGTIDPEFVYREIQPSVSITSLGDGATIRQAPNTLLGGYGADLRADNIELGANGRSSIELPAGMGLSFSNNLIINGAYNIGGLSIAGDSNNNTVLFGEHAIGDIAGFWGGLSINLGDGNDEVTVTNDMSVSGGGLEGIADIDIDMGAGNDRLTFLSNFSTTGVEMNLNIHMGDGNDHFASLGDFIANGSFVNLDINMGAGNDNALFLNGLTVDPYEEATTRFTLGSGNDSLVFNGDMDAPITLGTGRDWVVVTRPGVEFDLVDYDPREDRLVVANP